MTSAEPVNLTCFDIRFSTSGDTAQKSYEADSSTCELMLMSFGTCLYLEAARSRQMYTLYVSLCITVISHHKSQLYNLVYFASCMMPYLGQEIDNAPEERSRGITINASHIEYETPNRLLRLLWCFFLCVVFVNRAVCHS